MLPGYVWNLESREMWVYSPRICISVHSKNGGNPLPCIDLLMLPKLPTGTCLAMGFPGRVVESRYYWPTEGGQRTSEPLNVCVHLMWHRVAAIIPHSEILRLRGIYPQRNAFRQNAGK